MGSPCNVYYCKKAHKVNNVVVNYNLFLIIVVYFYLLYVLLCSVMVDQRHQLDYDFPTQINKPYDPNIGIRYTAAVPISSLKSQQ